MNGHQERKSRCPVPDVRCILGDWMKPEKEMQRKIYRDWYEALSNKGLVIE